MQDVINYLGNVWFTYWGQSRYQILLYVAIVVILLLERESWKRITYGWYAIAVGVGLMNPLTVKITSKIWGESVAYYCRQFSLIPIFIVISYGLVLLLTKTRGVWKASIVCFFVVLICINGHLIYQEEWYTRSANFYKIPSDIVEIADYFDGLEKKVKVAAPTSVSSYLRQYENVLQIQGRLVKNTDIEVGAQSDNPDVMSIMQSASQEGCDYLVVQNNDNAKRAYRKAGYTNCFQTDKYLVFSVGGMERWKLIFDNKNRLEKRVFLDKDDNVKRSSDRSAIVKYTYDLMGNVLTEHYYDEKENPAKFADGQYAVRYEYDENRRIVQITYLDNEDKAMQITKGYAIIRFTYDENGNKTSEHYYDKKGKPIALELGQYAEEYKYDENRRIVQITYLNKEDKAMQITKGYAIIRFTYDENGNKTSEHYYDEKGKPIALAAGQYAIKYEYDENGRVTQLTYLDEKDKASRVAFGYSIIRITYDEEGKKVAEHYYDEKGKPIAAAKGQYAEAYEYDEQLRLSQRTYLDENDKEMEVVYGYSVIRYFYDENGNKVEEIAYNLDGEIVYKD